MNDQEHEEYKPIPNDPRSYEDGDGNVLPVPDPEVFEPVDPLDIEPEIDPDEGRSDEFFAARQIIEAGIKNSAGKPEIEVEFWKVDDTVKEGGYYKKVSLAQFFGGMSLRHMVTEEEFDVLYERYKDKDSEHVAKQLGAVATASPVPEESSNTETAVESESEAEPEPGPEPETPAPSKKAKEDKEQRAKEEAAYDALLEDAANKRGSYELGRADLERRGIYPPYA